MYDLHIGPDRSVFGSSLHLDRTDRSKQLRWTEPIGPGDTDGPDRTNSIGSIRLGHKSVGPGRYRSGPDRGCPYLCGTRITNVFTKRRVQFTFSADSAAGGALPIQIRLEVIYWRKVVQ